MLEESAAVLDDFTSYFSFSRKRSGYSGVATYCRAKGATPNDSKEGLAGVTAQYHDHDQGQTDIELEFSKEELKELDAEGRAVLTWHKLEGANKCLVVINVYCPRADPERADRLAFKLRFYKLLEMRSAALVRAGNHVVIVGDVNTSHRPIDHCDPYEVSKNAEARSLIAAMTFPSVFRTLNLSRADNGSTTFYTNLQARVKTTALRKRPMTTTTTHCASGRSDLRCLSPAASLLMPSGAFILTARTRSPAGTPR
jgi:exonuclease III